MDVRLVSLSEPEGAYTTRYALRCKFASIVLRMARVQ